MRATILPALVVIAFGQHHTVWEQVFMSIDLDHDGQFSLKEFHVIIPKFDINGDGLISEAEFMSVWDHATAAAHDLARDDSAGRKLFKMEDHDHNGSLTMTEAMNIFTTAFDSNSDGMITKQEFKMAWFKIHDHGGHVPTGTSILG
ncbi:insoluble matrix shell protein 5-like [Haliotis rufescens]|uniref:insoluble matrix shell protein 5-like n=1 Tax=Haliotis rufescens TaxID=6454 RepID=UPI001EAFB764|nr:insoluble matrix shell protein 5-like [Haliotis rufescens]